MEYSDQNGAPDEESEYEGLDHDKYMRMWREWVDTYKDARAQSFRDQEYYDGDVKGTGEGHWTRTELAILKTRNQPPTVFNEVKNKINAIAGVEQRARSEPRGLPRTPKDQYASEIATDTLRFVKEQSRVSTTSAMGFMDALIAGYGVSEVGGEEDHVPETYVEWRDFFFDVRSRAYDFTDASYLGIAKWLDAEVAKEMYVPPEPERPQIPPQPQDPALLQQWAVYAQQAIKQYQAEVKRRQQIIDIIDTTAQGGGRGGDVLADSEYDDHPLEQFGDPKRKRIFVVDMWHRDPKRGWFRCVFTGAGKLFTQEAYLVEKNRWGRKEKVHPLKAFSLYVSKEGWRYGEVRGMRSPQDEVNMRRSKSMHLLTVRQLFYSPRAGIAEGNIDKVRKELARPDGVIEAMDITQIRVESNLELAAGQQKLGEEARAFMQMQGPNPQLQGEQGRATSGRAVLALQQAGLGQLGPIFDRFHDWEDRRYRSYWFRIQQFWTAPMYVRVTDDKNAARFAAVNGAVVYGEDGQPKMRSPNGMMMQPGGSDMRPNMQPGSMPGMRPGMGPNPMMGHNGGPPIDPSEFETGPMLAELDMDIIIDRAPEAATLQAEQFEELSKLAQAGVLGPPGPEVARMLISASALPTKTELLDMLDKIAQQPKGPTPEQKAQLEKIASEIEKNRATAGKTRVEAERTAAEIPETHARAAKTSAEARTENVNATMNEFQAGNALDAYDALTLGSPVAADQSGALGLPPS